MTRHPFKNFIRSTILAVATVTTFITAFYASPAHAIVGGVATSGASFPYYVRLTVNNATLCGGTLIDPEFVLTAAHCAVPFAAAAPANRNILLRDQFGTSARSVIVHPLYDGSVEHGHDVALIRIPPASLSPMPVVQVGAPGDPGAYSVNTPATVVGHGRTSWNGSPTPELRVLQTVLHSDDYMDDIYNPWYWIDNWNEPLMIGAGWSDQTVCKGDSGGPLTVQRGSAIVEVGVASFGPSDSCDQPGGFAELSGSQLAWIGSQVPSITTKWGPCAPGQSAGKWTAQYHSAADPLPSHDGPNYWDIACTPSYMPPRASVPPVMQQPPPPADTKGRIG